MEVISTTTIGAMYIIEILLVKISKLKIIFLYFKLLESCLLTLSALL